PHAQGRPWRQRHVAAGQDGLAGGALACSASHQLWPAAPRAGPAVAAAACSGGAGWIGGGGTSMQREPSAVASRPARKERKEAGKPAAVDVPDCITGQLTLLLGSITIASSKHP
ncbi:hypothetical protein Agub_g939, partial [Astrephomene gubernaculifera]